MRPLNYIRWRLGRRREVELLELAELAWRLFVLISVIAAGITPWLLLWRSVLCSSPAS